MSDKYDPRTDADLMSVLPAKLEIDQANCTKFVRESTVEALQAVFERIDAWKQTDAVGDVVASMAMRQLMVTVRAVGIEPGFTPPPPLPPPETAEEMTALSAAEDEEAEAAEGGDG